MTYQTTEHSPTALSTSLCAVTPCAASNLPQADAASFIQTKPQRCGVPAENAEPTRPATTLGNPSDAGRGFSDMMDRVRVEVAAIEHERLVEASKRGAGAVGVVRMRDHASAALHKRLAAELAVSHG